MNPFLLNADDQITSWKLLREELKVLEEPAALQRVADYWAQAPLLKMAYDCEDCSEWPGPWEMIAAKDWCPYSVAIGMEFTLRLAGWDKSRLTLITIRDYDISEQRTILKIDDSTVLNYTVGLVEKFPKTNHSVLAAFQHNGKRYFAITK